MSTYTNQAEERMDRPRSKPIGLEASRSAKGRPKGEKREVRRVELELGPSHGATDQRWWRVELGPLVAAPRWFGQGEESKRESVRDVRMRG